LHQELLTKIILWTKILPCSFANDSHIASQTEKHQKSFSKIVLITLSVIKEINFLTLTLVVRVEFYNVLAAVKII